MYVWINIKLLCFFLCIMRKRELIMESNQLTRQGHFHLPFSLFSVLIPFFAKIFILHVDDRPSRRTLLLFWFLFHFSLILVSNKKKKNHKKDSSVEFGRGFAILFVLRRFIDGNCDVSVPFTPLRWILAFCLSWMIWEGETCWIPFIVRLDFILCVLFSFSPSQLIFLSSPESQTLFVDFLSSFVCSLFTGPEKTALDSVWCDRPSPRAEIMMKLCSHRQAKELFWRNPANFFFAASLPKPADSILEKKASRKAVKPQRTELACEIH